MEKAILEHDPLGALSYVIVTASIHINTPQLRTLNPIIGETLETKIGNSNVYCEQVCYRHPPISALLVYGNGYKIYGSIEYEIKMGPRKAKYHKKGSLYAVLNDGAKYRINKWNTVWRQDVTISRRLHYRRPY